MKETWPQPIVKRRIFAFVLETIYGVQWYSTNTKRSLVHMIYDSIIISMITPMCANIYVFSTPLTLPLIIGKLVAIYITSFHFPTSRGKSLGTMLREKRLFPFVDTNSADVYDIVSDVDKGKKSLRAKKMVGGNPT